MSREMSASRSKWTDHEMSALVKYASKSGATSDGAVDLMASVSPLRSPQNVRLMFNSAVRLSCYIPPEIKERICSSWGKVKPWNMAWDLRRTLKLKVGLKRIVDVAIEGGALNVSRETFRDAWKKFVLETKRCKRCKADHPAADFYFKPSEETGLMNICKKIVKESVVRSRKKSSKPIY